MLGLDYLLFFLVSKQNPLTNSVSLIPISFVSLCRITPAWILYFAELPPSVKDSWLRRMMIDMISAIDVVSVSLN